MDKPASWVAEQKALTALSFITFILVVLPLPGFIKARNIGCILYAAWIAVLCLTSFINTIVWRDHARNIAPVWCDIYVRLAFMGNMGILSAGLVIARRVSLVATASSVWLRSENRTRAMYGDLAIGLTPPIAQLIEFWFMQGHRFDILEGLGCSAAVPFSILNICLTWVWNFIIGLISAFYCVRTLHTLLRRHRHVRQVLRMANMDLQLFYRLVAMAVVELCCTLPLVLFVFVNNMRGAYYPWKGLADLHLGFERVRQFPYEMWVAESAFQQSLWYQIGCGLLFFLLLGFTQDSRARYKRWLGLSRFFPDDQSRKPSTTGGKRLPFFCFRPSGDMPEGQEETSTDLRFAYFSSVLIAPSRSDISQLESKGSV
ncbi:hypothetical protein QCA50_003933 [Cerrena zonata]|uniref:Fungal pheromone STE3G-protein-coupled receptor n=1 Tax=Cerrena zonata TaxID=2478898 RepID=A0AAW0GFI6_9APHY